MTQKIIRIATDVGDLVLTEDRARQLMKEIQKQLPPVPFIVTSAMLAAGVEATHLGIPRRWRQDEVEGICQRVYKAMKALE